MCTIYLWFCLKFCHFLQFGTCSTICSFLWQSSVICMGIFKPSYQTGRLVCVCGMHSWGAADHGNSQCIFARSSSSLGRVPKQVLPGWWIQVPSIFLQHSLSRLWGRYIVSFSLYLSRYLSPLTQFLSLLLENQDSFCKVQSIKVPNLSPLNLCSFAFETGFCQISTYVEFSRISSPDLLLRVVFVCQISQCGFTKNWSSADFLLRGICLSDFTCRVYQESTKSLFCCQLMGNRIQDSFLFCNHRFAG